MTDKLRQAAEMVLSSLDYAYHSSLQGDDYECRKILWAQISLLRQALAEPDTGIDRGAWADVPDATKWVDELRGEDDELPPVKTYCGGKPNYCEPEEQPNSTTDVVEREPFGWLFKQADGDLYKLLRGEDVKWHEKNNPSWIKVSPLYTAPSQREWVGLTDEEANNLIEQAGLHYCWDTEGHFDAVTACSLVSREKERDDEERLKILKPLLIAHETKLKEKNG